MSDEPKTPTIEERFTALTARLESALAGVQPVPTPAAAQPPPTATPGIDYDKLAQAIVQAQTPAPTPAAAPAAPVAHALPTANGAVDLFNLNPAQLHAMGPQGVKENLSKLWAMGHAMSGAPVRPTPPAARVDVIERVKK